jgi:S1-C subfamily serine protease
MKRRFVATAAMLGLCLSSGFTLAAPEQPAKPGYLGVLSSKAEEGKSGAWIREVSPDSPAAKAGLHNGDLVTKVGDKEIKDVEHFTAAIAGHKPGDKVMMWVMRDGKEQKLEVALGERPARKAPAQGANTPRSEHVAKTAYLGVHTQEMTPELKQRLNLAVDKGAMVTEVMPETPAAKGGLKAEDVIIGVGDKDVANPQELRDAITAGKVGGEVVLKVMRGKDKVEVRCVLAEGPLALDLEGFQNQLPELFKGRFEDGQLPFKFDFKDLKDGRLPDMKKFTFDLNQVQEMQKKIEELEKRIAELEKKK